MHPAPLPSYPLLFRAKIFQSISADVPQTSALTLLMLAILPSTFFIVQPYTDGLQLLLLKEITRTNYPPPSLGPILSEQGANHRIGIPVTNRPEEVCHVPSNVLQTLCQKMKNAVRASGTK